MLTQKNAFMAKIEGTYGEDSYPTPTADAILGNVAQPRWTITKYARNTAGISFSKWPKLTGAYYGEIPFEHEIVGGGASSTPPPCAALLRACGLEEDINSTVVYTPRSSGFESVSCRADLDGVRHKMPGSRGTVRLVLEVDKPAIAIFTMRGLYGSIADASFPSAVTYSTLDPPVCMGITLTVGAYACVATRMEINLNVELANGPSFSGSAGVASIQIVDRNPGGTFDPEAVLEATHDFWAKVVAGTTMALSAVIGSDTGNKLTIDAPALQYDSVEYADRDKILAYNVPFILARNTGDDELVLTFS